MPDGEEELPPEEEEEDFDKEVKERVGTGGPIRTPFLASGAEPVSDTERLRLRPYVTSLDNLVRIEANRQLEDTHINTLTFNFGCRRWLEVGPTEQFLKRLPYQRHYRFERVKAEGSNKLDGVQPIRFEKIYLPPGFQTHDAEGRRDYTQVVGPATTLEKSETTVAYEQHFWVLDLEKPERASRDFTGFMCIPHEPLGERFKDKLRGRLWRALERARSIDDLSLQERFDIIAAHADARLEIARDHFEYRKVVETFEKYLQSGKSQDEFYFWFNATERARFWREFEERARKRDETHWTQTIPEAIAAAESLADLVSAVVKPLLTAEPDPKDPEEKPPMIILWGTQDTRYADTDELNDLRKTIGGWFKYRLGAMRAIAQLEWDFGDARKAGDGWFPGSWDGMKAKDFKVRLPRTSRRILRIIHQVLYGPLADWPGYWMVHPGPELGVWHLRFAAWAVQSFHTLIEMADHASNGGGISDKDMREKWLPKLAGLKQKINWDDVVWGWWDRERLYANYDPAHPEREFRGVPKNDWFFWVDFRAAMDVQMSFRQMAEYVNMRFRMAGLEGVEVRLDGEDPNFFRFEENAWEIWNKQPAKLLEERFRRELREAEDMGVVELRPIIRRQFAGLPVIHGDGREDDLLPLLTECLEIADNLSDDFIAEISHAFDGTARGASFGLTGGILQGGYRRGVSIHEAKKQKRLRLRINEIPLKGGYYDKMRGLTEAAQFDPDLLSEPKLLKGAITSWLESRALTRVYAVHLATIIARMRGILAISPMVFRATATHWVDQIEQSWLSEEMRLLGADRILRLETAEMYSRRWVHLEGGLLVPSD